MIICVKIQVSISNQNGLVKSQIADDLFSNLVVKDVIFCE